VETHDPFHASVLRPALQVDPMHKTPRMRKLINVVLLLLINDACVSVCCVTVLLSQLVSLACVQVPSSNSRGSACGCSGKRSGEERYSVALYLYIYTFQLLMSSVSLGVKSRHIGRQSLSIPRTVCLRQSERYVYTGRTAAH